jgi:hypothetical protein
MNEATTWTYVVTATNIINDRLEVDTTLTPFYVSVLQEPGTEENEYEDEESLESVESRAVDLAIKKAYENWGIAWYHLEIHWISENWGRGELHYHNPQHWTKEAA